jgi:aminoglycoside phosphotransferase (APT) family kinase protein
MVPFTPSLFRSRHPLEILTLLTRWHDAVLTLVKLHRIKPASVGLSAYGKPTGFYNRQIATWQTLEESQAATADVESGKLVSRVPRTTQMLEFFKDPSLQPRDRSSLMHGDYKIDNLVFHKTEPKVIGILE